MGFSPCALGAGWQGRVRWFGIFFALSLRWHPLFLAPLLTARLFIDKGWFG